jgi:hypothetical protein
VKHLNSRKSLRALLALSVTSAAVALWLALVPGTASLVMVPISILSGFLSFLAFIWTLWFRAVHCRRNGPDYRRLTAQVWRWGSILSASLYVVLSSFLTVDVILLAVDDPPLPPDSWDFFLTYWIPVYAEAVALAALLFSLPLIHWINRLPNEQN